MNRFKILSIIASIAFLIVATSSAQADSLTTYGDATVTTGPNGTGWTLTSDNTGNGYSGIRVTVTNPLTVSSLTQLSASYQTLQGTFHGGAPRFGLRDSLGNQAWIYWGTPTGGGSFSDPLAGAFGSTGNYASLVSPDIRVYSNNFGGFNQPNTGVTCSDPDRQADKSLLSQLIAVSVLSNWSSAPKTSSAYFTLPNGADTWTP